MPSKKKLILYFPQQFQSTACLYDLRNVQSDFKVELPQKKWALGETTTISHKEVGIFCFVCFCFVVLKFVIPVSIYLQTLI